MMNVQNDSDIFSKLVGVTGRLVVVFLKKNPVFSSALASKLNTGLINKG